MQAKSPTDAADLPATSTATLAELPAQFSLDEDAQRRVQERWQRVRAYGVCMGGYNILAPQGLYCELLTGVQIAPLPNSPAHFLGLTNVRGNLIPVYQLEPLLNIPNPKQTYVLLMGTLPNAGAVVVTSKPTQFDLATLQRSEPSEPLPDILQCALTATYQYQQSYWYAIDHISLFNQLANAGNAGESTEKIA